MDGAKVGGASKSIATLEKWTVALEKACLQKSCDFKRSAVYVSYYCNTNCFNRKAWSGNSKSRRKEAWLSKKGEALKKAIIYYIMLELSFYINIYGFIIIIYLWIVFILWYVSPFDIFWLLQDKNNQQISRIGTTGTQNEINIVYYYFSGYFELSMKSLLNRTKYISVSILAVSLIPIEWSV